jgi:hypothetical protein
VIAGRQDNVNLQSNEVSSKLWQLLQTCLREAQFNRRVTAVNKTGFAKSLAKSFHSWRSGRSHARP